MSTIKHIRTEVFGVTQQEFAAIAGVTQSTVHRWENGGAPTLAEMTAIRDAAKRERKTRSKWNDALFFSAPEERAAS